MLGQEWFNDDFFWECFAPIMFDKAHWAEVPAVAGGSIRLARTDGAVSLRSAAASGAASLRSTAASGAASLRSTAVFGAASLRSAEDPPACLDLCCGFGRIGLELARQGFALTGVDITGPYLETAREDAAAEGLDAEFILEDVRLFKRPGAFDIAVNLYNSFGYFEDPADDKRLVRNAFESLKPGGVFFIETLGKEILARDFVESEWFRRAGFFVLTEYKALDSWGAMKNTWRLIPERNYPAGAGNKGLSAKDPAIEGGVIEKTFVHRLYAASELRALLLEAGFASAEVYGDWDERPYDSTAVKLIVLGRKAG
ncbi:MAG: class I SAM-dependent methyltransferase [Spirochaetaceae bacterium]|jgi:SAM-dependent methyltransferase|nr:class I SAM-dependent methyltransferase [Spirochaetaceae bacterium]